MIIRNGNLNLSDETALYRLCNKILADTPLASPRCDAIFIDARAVRIAQEIAETHTPTHRLKNKP